MSFVRIIQVTDLLSLTQLLHLVLSRYPNARIQRGHVSGTALIVIPDLLWSQSSQGPEGFFRGLCQSGLISGFHHKRYSDQEEVRS